MRLTSASFKNKSLGHPVSGERLLLWPFLSSEPLAQGRQLRGGGSKLWLFWAESVCLRGLLTQEGTETSAAKGRGTSPTSSRAVKVLGRALGGGSAQPLALLRGRPQTQTPCPTAVACCSWGADRQLVSGTRDLGSHRRPRLEGPTRDLMLSGCPS